MSLFWGKALCDGIFFDKHVSWGRGAGRRCRMHMYTRVALLRRFGEMCWMASTASTTASTASTTSFH